MCATRAVPGGVGLCGIEKVQKRYLIAAVARNLGLIMRKVFAMGTPRGLQAEGGLVSSVCLAWLHVCHDVRRWCFGPTTPRCFIFLRHCTLTRKSPAISAYFNGLLALSPAAG